MKKTSDSLKVYRQLKEEVEELLKNYKVKKGSIEIDNDTLNSMIDLLMVTPSYKECLDYLDLSKVSFEGKNMAGISLLDGTNANIDPQTVKGKTIYGSNFKDIDMSGKNFDGVCIEEANLSNTNSLIELDKLNGSIEGTNLNGCTCIVSKDTIEKIVIDENTILDNTIFVDKDSHDNGNYQIIAAPYVKKIMKRKKQ